MQISQNLKNNSSNFYQITQFHESKNVILSDTPFSYENGLLTYTQKVKRKSIAEHFKSELDKVYEDKGVFMSEKNKSSRIAIIDGLRTPFCKQYPSFTFRSR